MEDKDTIFTLLVEHYLLMGCSMDSAIQRAIEEVEELDKAH